MSFDEGDCCAVLCLLFLVIAANGIGAVWEYFYVIAEVYTTPRSAVNRTSLGFTVYTTFMGIWGFLLGALNLAIAVGLATLIENCCVALLYIVFIVPTFAFLVIMPFFGRWIVPPLVQNHAWNHGCDGYPLYAILDGKGFKDSFFVSNVAHIYQNSNQSLLFSYDVNSVEGADIWAFKLREFDTDQGNISVSFYPTMQQVTYNFINATLTGTCTIPVVTGGNLTDTRQCMNGTFNPIEGLSFNLTSNIPLNSTTNATIVPNTTSYLKSVSDAWLFEGGPPALILKTNDPEISPPQTVLKTSILKKGDCTQLKVCMSGIQGREGSVVGAEVLVPLGLLMLAQGDNAFQCTAPKDAGGGEDLLSDLIQELLGFEAGRKKG